MGKSLSYVNSFCSSNGIKVNVNGNGTGNVISQSVPEGANVEDVSSISITLSGGMDTNKVTNKKEENQDKKEDKKEEPTEVVPNTPEEPSEPEEPKETDVIS